MSCAACFYVPVGGLAGDVQEEELRDRFTRAGADVIKVEVMRDPGNGTFWAQGGVRVFYTS